jgi:hypothetical protein
MKHTPWLSGPANFRSIGPDGKRGGFYSTAPRRSAAELRMALRSTDAN